LGFHQLHVLLFFFLLFLVTSLEVPRLAALEQPASQKVPCGAFDGDEVVIDAVPIWLGGSSFSRRKSRHVVRAGRLMSWLVATPRPETKDKDLLYPRGKAIALPDLHHVLKCRFFPHRTVYC
jgi:hypothetical protein